MKKAILGIAALLTASAGQASIVISFNNPTGDLGSNTHMYSNGGYSVTASGYSNYNFGTNTGTANDLYGKADGGDENGVGLVGDPANQHEIWYAGDGFQTTPAIILDVTSLLGNTTAASFSMGSTTNGEDWILGGYNGTTWTELLEGNADGSYTALPGWGTYSQYAFLSGGTVNGNVRTAGNVLLSALDVTPSVPEPATWAMMLVGFGAAGFGLRRARGKALQQLA